MGLVCCYCIVSFSYPEQTNIRKCTVASDNTIYTTTTTTTTCTELMECICRTKYYRTPLNKIKLDLMGECMVYGRYYCHAFL